MTPITPSVGRPLPHLASRIFGVPLAIAPSKLDAILAVLGPRLGLSAEAIPIIAIGETSDQDEQAEYSIQSGIAVIPIMGTLVKRSAGLDAESGMTSYATLAGMIQGAIADPDVKAILLDCDSPGGEVGGMFDLSDMIYSLRGTKPLVALANDGAYSAAYCIASAADCVFVTREGGVGSVGCYMLHLDRSGADKQQGLRYTYIHAGDSKVEGNPHEALSAAARTKAQSEVDRTRNLFAATVARNRGVSVKQILNTEAGMFHGPAGVPLLADGIGGLSLAASELESRINGKKLLSVPSIQSNHPGDSMTRSELQGRMQLAAAETSITGLRDDAPSRTPPPSAPQRRALPPAREPGTFRNLGEFLQAVKRADSTFHSSAPKVDPRLDELQRRAAPAGSGITTPSIGGWLVDPQMSESLLLQVYDTGQLLQRTTRIPITLQSSTGIKIPMPDEQSRVTGSRFGGIQGYFVNEADSAIATKPKFRLAELSLKKLIGLCYVTDELLADSGALSEFMREAFTLEFVYQAENAIINGTGSGKPAGILNAPGAIVVNKQSGQSASTLVAANLEDMLTRFWDPLHEGIWLADRSVKQQLLVMTQIVGAAGSAVPGWYQFAAGPGEPYDRLLGYPIVYPEYMQLLGTSGDIALINPRRYVWTEKEAGIQGALSLHVKFLTDEAAFRFTWLVDGQPIDGAPITPSNSGSTCSPYVLLQSRP